MSDPSPPFELINADGDPSILLVCDHASNALPVAFGTLGLPATELQRHIAYDIGAAALTRAMSAALAAPAILARYSRLLIDLNRGEDDPTLVMRLSDGSIIPGNARIGPSEIAERARRYHAPYHAAITAALDTAQSRGIIPAILSVHSFTPAWKGVPRPWHFGVLWDRDDRLARPLMAALRALPGIIVGDNEPYSGELENDCMNQHGTQRGLPHVLLEVRQDLIADEEGVSRIAALLLPVLTPLLTDPHIRQRQGGAAMDEALKTEIEAAAFRRLVDHLRQRTDVQNIDLMTLAGFCRNCLGDWVREAAEARGVTLSKDDARARVYGMPPAEWKAKYQREASPEQKAAFEKAHKGH